MTAHAVGDQGETIIVGESPAIRRAVQVARMFARTALPVLITGETGTGKELFAQEIHRWSGRRGPLVDVNCGALPRDLVEGELFGHRRGAYTGAATDTSGLIAHSDGGTLFLDELSSLPVEGQVKLLRAIETREIRRLGDTLKRRVDFRLVSAVHHGLAGEVASGRLRADLLQRLAGVVIHLPPLVDRIGDMALLARHFLRQFRCTLGCGADLVLGQYAWPGNVRELRSVIERAIVLSSSTTVSSEVLVEAIELGPAGTHSTRGGERSVRSALARKQLLGAAEQNGWDPRRLAASLGVSRATLYRRLRALGVSLTQCQAQGLTESHETR